IKKQLIGNLHIWLKVILLFTCFWFLVGMLHEILMIYLLNLDVYFIPYFFNLYILNGAEQVYNVAISVLHNGTFSALIWSVSLFDVGTIDVVLDVVLVIDKAKLLAIYDMHNLCGKHYQYHTNYFDCCRSTINV
ncbi:hypothetical protein ACJX0J_039458, partial [Zea mays]